jgi:hypothetical protein
MERTQSVASDKRLEELSWAAFLIMTGMLWLMPAERVPEGAWLIGIGTILLMLNAARRLNGIAVSGFTTVLGVLTLVGGVVEWLGIDLPLLAVVLVAFGASLVVRPWVRRQRPAS